MGAYDNPNINVGIDRESGQLIGQALTSVGQSIAQGVKDANKIAIQQQEKIEANRLEALQRSIGIITTLDNASIEAGENKYADLGSAVNTASFENITEVGSDGEEIGIIPPMSQDLDAIGIGTATSAQIKKSNQWKRFIPQGKELVENISAFGEYANNLKSGEIYTAGSSSKLLSFFNGEFSDADTKVVYNKKSGFSYLTKASGGVMSKIGDGNFSFNWNKANAGIVKSMNDADLYHVGFGNESIITIPPMQELSYEEFTGGKNGKGKGAIIKANSSGTARFYNQALYVEEEIIEGVNAEGNYTQVIKKPNVENLEALAIETANARIDGHLTTGPNSYKSLNAYFDNYFNPPVGPGRGISIDEYFKFMSDGNEKVTLIQKYLDTGVLGFIYNDKTNKYTEITRLEPESPTESMLMENYTQLPGDLLFKTASIDNMKTMMASINNKILGTYSKPDAATATAKDKTYQNKFQKITPSKGDVSDNQFAAKFTSLNKPVVIDGKAQDYNQFDSNNKNIDYTKPDTGAPGLLNAIIKDPALSAYKSVITDNYLPMVSGGKVVTSAHKKITDKYAALIGAQNRIPANTPLEKFPALIKLDVADAAKTDIDKFNLDVDKGLVWNLNTSGKAPGKSITTEELLLQLPSRFTTVRKYQN